MPFNTRNPIPSGDLRDLDDNARNIDTWANDKTKLSHPDRFGVQRRTWHGIEQEAKLNIQQAIDAKNAAQEAAMMSGFSKYADTLAQLEAGIGTDYVDGDVVLVFQDEARGGTSSIYKVESGAPVFKNAFDKTRQDLLSFTGTISADAEWSDVPAHSDPAFDVQAHALAGRTEFISNELTQPTGNYALGGLQDYSKLRTYSGYAKEVLVGVAGTTSAGIYGRFFLDESDTTSTDNGGTVIVTADGKRFKRRYAGDLNAEWFGIFGNGVDDDWPGLQRALDEAARLRCGVDIPVPRVKYIISRPLVKDDGVQIYGIGSESVLIEKTTALLPLPALGKASVTRSGITTEYDYDKNAILIIKKPSGRQYPNGLGIHNITLRAQSGAGVEYGVYAPRCARSEFSMVTIKNVITGWFTYDTWMCTFRRIECEDVTNGFLWANDSTGIGSGTSCTFINCFANRVSSQGFSLYGLTYSSLINCAAENVQGITAGARPVAYFFQTCRGLNVISCGSESVKGFVFRIGGGSVNIIGGDYRPLLGDTFSAETAVIQVDGGAKVHIGGGAQFGAVTSPGNIYNEIVKDNAQIIYDGTVTRPSGGNANPLFTGGGEIVVLGLKGEGYSRRDSTGTYYSVESSTTGTSIPTANLELKNPTSGFQFPLIVEPTAGDRKLQWQNSSSDVTGGWEWKATNAAINKVVFAVYNNGAMKIAPPVSTSALTGSASALPAQPAGYITVEINGVSRKIPYYN